MKRRNRKKELRHKLKQEAYVARAKEKRERYEGKSEYIRDYLKEIESIEASYNRQLDEYVETEVERQLSLNPEVKQYHEIEEIDYASEIRHLGLVVSNSDVRVVPDLVELGYIIKGWKEDFEEFMSEIPENYANSDFGIMAREGFIDEISTHFVDNQESPSKLRNYQPSLQNYVREIRERYLSQGTSTVFEYNNFF